MEILEMDIEKIRNNVAEVQSQLEIIRKDVARVHPEHATPKNLAELQQVTLQLCDKHDEAMRFLLFIVEQVDEIAKNLKSVFEQLETQNEGS